MNNQHIFTANTEQQLPDVAKAILKVLPTDATVALVGPMGAGKTTLVASLARELGVEAGEVSSPTFAIVNEYLASNGHTIYHFDLYRLESEAEVADTGFEEYIDSDALCLIEWPDRAGALLPDDCHTITISVNPDGSRQFTLTGPC